MKLRALMLLAPCVAAACMTVRPVLAPANYIPQANPDVVWVTAQSGEMIPIARPSLRGDSITGQWLGTTDPVTVALPQVQFVQARQPDRARTTLLVATVGVLAGFVVWQATRPSGPSRNCMFDPRGGSYCP